VSEEIYFSDDQKMLLEWMAEMYIVPIHNVLQLFFPKNLREKITKLTYQKIKDKEFSYQLDFPNILSNAQKKIFQELKDSSFPITLFYGVTGSGKTHIYQELVREDED